MAAVSSIQRSLIIMQPVLHQKRVLILLLIFKKSYSFSVSECFATEGSGDLNSSGDLEEGKGSMVRGMQTQASSNGHGLSARYHSSSHDGSFLGQQKETTHGNRVSNGAVSIH